MARVECATQGWGWVTNFDGTARANVAVTFATLADAPVTIWDAKTGGAAINPVMTDTAGLIPGWIDVGSYKMTVGALTHTIEAVIGTAVDLSPYALSADLTTHTGATAVHGVDTRALYRPRLVSGKYYRTPGTTSTTGPLTNNTLYLTPWYFDGSFDRIIFDVITSAGEAGSTANPVVYADSGGYPGALAFNAGPVSTSAIASLGDTTAVSFSGTGLFWWGIYMNNAPTTRPQLRSISANFHSFAPMPTAVAAQAANNIGLSLVTGGGTVPTTAPAGMTGTTIPPSICVRIA